MKVKLGESSCYLDKNKDGFFVSRFQTEEKFKRQGHAKSLLKLLRKFAKRQRVIIALNCAPYGFTTNGCLTFEETKSMYEKAGFKVASGSKSYMEYTPKSLRG